VSLTYGPSTVKRARRTKAQLADLDDAIVAAVADEHPVTLRGVFYRASSAGAVDKTERGYRAVGRRLLALRRTGRVPYGWITDGTRYVLRARTHHDVDTMLADAAASYRRMLWQDQAAAVQIFTEKDAISGVISSVTREWDVPLGVMRGYSSESFAYQMAEEISNAGKPVYVYQLGDHDPSGVDAWREFQTKVKGFLAEMKPPLGQHLAVFERLAVNEDQIEQYNLPTRPTKRNDTRAAGFRGDSVEVDAIPATILRSLVEEAIVQHLDVHTYELTLEVERQERQLLTSMIEGNTA
jgi:hypothetical protein